MKVLENGATGVYVNVNAVYIHPHQWNQTRKLVLVGEGEGGKEEGGGVGDVKSTFN